MINNKIETTLIHIIPEYFDIKTYNPNKLNEYTITICNNCNIPLILSLSSSDSNILTLKESSIKIGKKKKKAISFLIKDKNFSNKKNVTKPKKLYIFIKNDLIEEKFEIILSYYSFSANNNNSKNKIFLSFNKRTKYIINSNENKEKIITPKDIKKANLINLIKNNISNEDIVNTGSNDFYNNNWNIGNEDKTLMESEYLNKAVQELRDQILYLKQMLEHSQIKIKKLELQRGKIFNNLFFEKCISFFVNGNNSKKELYDYQNMMLKEENEKLKKMVNLLEKKIISFEKHEFLNQNSNYNGNKNFIFNNYNYS